MQRIGWNKWEQENSLIITCRAQSLRWEEEAHKAVSQDTSLFLFSLVSASLKIPAVYPLCPHGSQKLSCSFLSN